MSIGSWRATHALRRAVVCGAGLVIAGVVLHKVGLMLIGAPLLISAALGVASAPYGTPGVRQAAAARVVEPGRRHGVALHVDPARRAEFAAVRVPDVDGVGRVHLLPAERRVIDVRKDGYRWGEAVDARPDHLFAGVDALLIYGPVTGKESRRSVLPPVHDLPAGPLPPRLAGLVGEHRSPRRGDATELRDIRPFQHGDRLRGVDWRVSLRASAGTSRPLSTLYVRERHAEADAELVFALDTRLDVGNELGEWPQGRGGCLDVAARAVSSLAASFLRQGDRVGLADLGKPWLGMAPRPGHRQLLRMRHQLVYCRRAAGWSRNPVLRRSQVPPGAVLVLFSPLLDDEVTHVAVHAARRGGRVLVVDVLPDPLRPDRQTSWGPAVLRVLRAEHRLRCATLREQGVPVLHWRDGPAETFQGADAASAMTVSAAELHALLRAWRHRGVRGRR